MAAIQRLKNALEEFRIEEDVVAQIFQGYENVSDRSKKDQRAAFFIQAIERMEELLDRELCHDIRDACACSKGGWRLKAMQKIAKECEGQSVEQKLQAIGQVTYMGNPVLNEDGTIAAGIGDVGGFAPVRFLTGWHWNRRSRKPIATVVRGIFAITIKSHWAKDSGRKTWYLLRWRAAEKNRAALFSRYWNEKRCEHRRNNDGHDRDRSTHYQKLLS